VTGKMSRWLCAKEIANRGPIPCAPKFLQMFDLGGQSGPPVAGHQYFWSRIPNYVEVRNDAAGGESGSAASATTISERG
jgi:hypothetical protein